MLVDEAIEAVRAARDGRGWTRPLAGTWCFDALAGTVERLLVGTTARPELPAAALGALAAGVERVVLVYLDAFGWQDVERHREHPFLRRVVRDGRALPLTTRWPSTTALAVTTIHTGLAPEEHGVAEWFCRDPALDRVIAPLLFAFADGPRDGLLDAGVVPTDVFGTRTLYADLARAGVGSSVHQSQAITPSRPSDALLAGATAVPFAHPQDGLAAAARALAVPGPTYQLVYLEGYDATLHRHGPGAHADAELLGLLDAIERELVRGAAGPALLLVTADHGSTPVDPARSLLLDVAWPGIVAHLRRGADGQPLAPCGSCRDLFLHVLPASLEEVERRVAALVAHIATVHRVADLAADGWLGPGDTTRLVAALGDLVVVPRPGEAVWWSGDGRFGQHLRAQHGGPWPCEMEIPLLALAIG